MKSKQWIGLVLAGWFVVLSPMALVQTGCKSVNKSAFKTVKTVDITADVAMKAWGVYVRDRHPGVVAELRVESAYNQYLNTVIVVADAGAALAKSDNQDTRAKLDIALAAAAAALGDLTNLVSAFGVKLK